LQRVLAGVETITPQRLLQRDPDDGPGGSFQLRPPQLSLPRYEGPSLGVGQLRLDPAPFQTLSLENTFSPSRLFQPSPELLQQLVDHWLLQYRLTHPGPPLAENAWQQLWSAWRRLTDQWLARGADAPLHAELAQDLLREQAAQAVLNLQPAGSSTDVGDIAGQVWPAFERALGATQFYPRLRQNAEGLVREHWPALIPVLGTALGVSLGMGLGDNDWRAMQRLSALLPQLNTDIPLGNRWTMSLGFSESQPIRGMREQGVVIGVQPSIGFRYSSEAVQFSIDSSVNLRFETGQESERGFQVHTSPGVNAVLRW